MLWGWVQRWRSERRLAAAADLLGLASGRPRPVSGGELTVDQKVGLLTRLTSSLEARDPYTHGHSRRVARHASNIAKNMGLPRDEVAKIRAAGAMHDVGKLETPREVLDKQGKLTDEEFAIIQRHPVDGADMVAILDDEELTAIVRHHHERLDGTGYPDRLAGDAIPMGARIMAVADTFDAITSTRPYRPANAHKKALDILVAEAGTQLDPEAVRAFCSCYSGRRPLAYWTTLLNLRPRLAASVGAALAPGNALAAVNVVAGAATVVAAGAAVAAPLTGTSVDMSRALAGTGAAQTAATPATGSGRPASQTIARGHAPRPAAPKAKQPLRPADRTRQRRAGAQTTPAVPAPGGGSATVPTKAKSPPAAAGTGTAEPPRAAPGKGSGNGKGNGGAKGNGGGKGKGNGGGKGKGKGLVRPVKVGLPPRLGPVKLPGKGKGSRRGKGSVRPPRNGK
ncbi:MAG: HD domain-containing phosphohydrolase [Thermoleophilaceae bacterium]